jgi:hypothetical protein
MQTQTLTSQNINDAYDLILSYELYLKPALSNMLTFGYNICFVNLKSNKTQFTNYLYMVTLPIALLTMFTLIMIAANSLK